MVLPTDVLEAREVVYRSGTIAGPTVLRDIRQAASQAVQAERLREAGLEVAEVASLLRALQVENVRITAAGEEGGDASPPSSSPTSSRSSFSPSTAWA